jgi:cytidyltransferase-like protein
MQRVQWSVLGDGVAGVRSVGVMLGSFDPPHLGHAWIVAQLLDRFEAVALLVPTFHFDKTVSYPCNATFDQRMVMLLDWGRLAPGRISIGVASEILYVRLVQRLGRTFPCAEIGFGMGDDSFRRLLDSRSYFERRGEAWTPDDERTLAALQRTSMVFGRWGASDARGCKGTRGLPKAPGPLPVPERLREISSTQVRARVRRLREQGVPPGLWPALLSDCLAPETPSHIARFGLY